MGKEEGVITKPAGFRASGVSCGIKSRPGIPDLGILLAEAPATVAGMFTTNRVCAAPVVLSRERVAQGKVRGLVVNSGNANACTGEQGLTDARKMT